MTNLFGKTMTAFAALCFALALTVAPLRAAETKDAAKAKPAAAAASAESHEGHDHEGHNHEGEKAGGKKGPGGPGGPGQRKQKGEPYPLETSAVSGEKLGADAVTYDYKGRELRFANQAEVATFEATPDKFIADVDAKIIEKTKKDYPVMTCPISGEKVQEGGSMKPVDIVYNNRLVRLCCPGCKEDFAKDPQATLKKIDEAVIARDKASYPTEKCLMMPEELAERDVVVQNRLIRVCCGKCEKQIQKDPNKWLKKLDEAKAAAKTAGPAPAAK